MEIIVAIDDARIHERRGFDWHAGSYPGIVPFVNAMPNPQLDQFTHALFWKAVPWLILGGGGAILVSTALKWLERWAIRFGQSRRAAKASANKTAASGRDSTDTDAPPQCPECDSPMVKRRARKGRKAGEFFWGCSRYPECRGTRDR